MPSSLFKITCSKIRRTDYAIIQLCSSLSAPADKEQELYNQLHETVNSYGQIKACELAKSVTRTCIIANRNTTHRITNTYVQVLLYLTVLVHEQKTFISIAEVCEHFSICVATLRDIIKVLSPLQCCYYDFHHRILYESIRIFQELKTESGTLFFAFSKEFCRTILRQGCTLLLPADIIYKRLNTQNSFLTISLLCIFSHQSLQRAYQLMKERYNLNVSFRIKDLFSAAGIQPEEERLDNLRRWVWELCIVLSEYEEIDSIELCSSLGNQIFGDSVEDFTDSRRLKIIGKKTSLLNSTINLHFVVD